MSAPDLCETVEVPEFFSPSKLHGATQCKLRAVQEASRVDRLPSGPTAEFGTILHRVFELAVEGAFAEVADPKAEIQRVVAEIIAETEAKMASSSSRRHMVPLKNGFSPRGWRDKMQSVVRTALWAGSNSSHTKKSSSSVADDSKARGGVSTNWKPSFEALGDGDFSEIGISASRIRGKMDFVSIHGNDVAVKDLKTGRTHEPDGSIVGHIAAQLHFYGLAVLEHRPNAHVKLAVIKGQEFSIEFGPAEQSAAKSLLHSLLDSLPSGATMGARDLASPGEVCRWCSVRHSCPAYREWAPTQWIDDELSLGDDIWGEVLEVHATATGRDVVIRDAAGRRCHVDRVDARHGPLEPGMNAWFFGLAREPARWGEFGRHPVVFWELPSHLKQRRAWALRIYSE